MQNKKLHQAHLTEWAARFSEQKASGLTVRQWCNQNHVSIHKYNYWKYLLKEEVVDQMLPDIVSLPVPAPLPAPDPVLPQNVQPDQTLHDLPFVRIVRIARTSGFVLMVSHLSLNG